MEACVATSSELSEASTLAEQGQFEEAAALCRTVLARNLDDPSALHLLGVILLRQDNAAEAVPLLASVADRSGDAAAWHALAEALLRLGLREEAEARWRRAIALPNPMAESFVSLGNLAFDRDDIDAAVQHYRAAVAVRPDFHEAWNNLGNALTAQHRMTAAWRAYDKALALRHNAASAAFGYALSLLLGGDFAAGWRHFEARREVPALRWNYQRRPNLPQWQPGMALDGKRVLLMAEQGSGDVIQYARYVPLLAARSAEVTLELPPDMQVLFATLPGAARIISLMDADPACDIACPLLSLPLYFATMLDSIPQDVPYASVPPERAARWRAWLGPSNGRRRIGLVCAGRPTHPLDRSRSIPLARLAPLFDAADCDFILAQQQMREQDRAVLGTTPNLRWAGPELHDFADTAALLAEVDLLISVDTSVAHLGGALARPVWLLLPYAPDYRWLLGRGDTPWYPTLRLYRQAARGDWDTVIATVRQDLDALR